MNNCKKEVKQAYSRNQLDGLSFYFHSQLPTVTFWNWCILLSKKIEVFSKLILIMLYTGSLSVSSSENNYVRCLFANFFLMSTSKVNSWTRVISGDITLISKFSLGSKKWQRNFHSIFTPFCKNVVSSPTIQFRTNLLFSAKIPRLLINSTSKRLACHLSHHKKFIMRTCQLVNS